MRELKVCKWCLNRTHEVCLDCRQEAKYRFLEPKPCSDWESPPELPSMRDMVEMTPYERLALIYLSVIYRQEDNG